MKSTERDGASTYGDKDFTEEGLYQWVKDLDGLDSLWLDFDEAYGTGPQGGSPYAEAPKPDEAKKESSDKKKDDQGYKFKVKVDGEGIVGEHVPSDKNDPNFDQDRLDEYEQGEKIGGDGAAGQPKYEQEAYDAEEVERDL